MPNQRLPRAGLKFVFWGMLISAVWSVVQRSVELNPLLSSAPAWVSTVLILAGIWRLAHCNDHFRSSRVLYFVNLGLSLLSMLVSMGSSEELMAIGLLLVIATLIVGFAAVYQLCAGITQAAGNVGQRELAAQVTQRARHYILSLASAFAGSYVFPLTGALGAILMIGVVVYMAVALVLLLIILYRASDVL